MRAFFGRLLLLLPIPALLIGLNFAMDPARLFDGGRYEQEMARLLLAGNNVVSGNFEERLLQKYYVAGLAEPKDVVVIGSSRTMMITAEMFPGQTFFNSSVSAIGLEDLIAIYGMYRLRDQQPKVVVLGLEPSLLNRNDDQTRWKVIRADYEAAMVLHGRRVPFSPPDLIDERQLELLSPEYFQRSVKTLAQYVRTGSRGYTPIGVTEADEEDRDRLTRRDGSLGYPLSVRGRSVAEVNDMARRVAVGISKGEVVFELGNFVTFDSTAVEQLQAFLDLLEADGVRTVFYLAPYHPIAYTALASSPQHRIVLEVERYYRDLAAARNITVVGSYDPGKLSLTEADFLDARHPKAHVSVKILADLQLR